MGCNPTSTDCLSPRVYDTTPSFEGTCNTNDISRDVRSEIKISAFGKSITAEVKSIANSMHMFKLLPNHVRWKQANIWLVLFSKWYTYLCLLLYF